MSQQLQYLTTKTTNADSLLTTIRKRSTYIYNKTTSYNFHINVNKTYS